LGRASPYPNQSVCAAARAGNSAPKMIETARVYRLNCTAQRFYILWVRKRRPLITRMGGLSGLRGSNPCPRLGKPLYYHCTKPALRSAEAFALHEALLSYDRISATTASRFASINRALVASRFNRSSGSVFDGRTLKCQSGYSTEIPSSSY